MKQHLSAVVFMSILLLVSAVLVQAASDDVNDLIKQLLDQNFAVSSAAANSLAQIGESAVQPLGERFRREGNLLNRLKIVNLLGRIESEQTLDYLIEALSDSETVVRDAAIRALTVHDGAVERIQTLLFTKHYRSRASAYEALRQLGVGVSDLAQYLSEQLVNSTDQLHRQIALWMLKEMGPDAADSTTVLVELLRDSSEDPLIRHTILETLHHVDPEAVPLEYWAMALSSYTIKHFERVFWLANDYLIKAGADAVPVLLPLVESADPEVRTFALTALGRAAGHEPKVQEVLSRSLDDPDWYVAQAAAFALGEPPPAEPRLDFSQPVSISESTTAVIIDNGIVKLVINKNTGVVSSLTGFGAELLGSGGRIYYDTITTPGGTWWPSPERFEIVRSDEDIVHTAFIKKASSQQPLDVTLNYILKRGDSGFYFYVTYGHYGDYPVEFGQARHVVRFDANKLRYMAVADTKMGRMPTDELVAAGEEVQDATIRLGDGSVYTKYNWQVFEGEHELHGIMGDSLGLWMISAGKEYYNGGPFKQNRTVHYDNVLLQIMQSGHFGAGGQLLPAGSGWEKIYGPYFIYINRGENLAEMWIDAKTRAYSERQQWPYQWVDEELYPLERAEVSGRLVLADGSGAADAWVILGGSSPHWQHQGTGYLFYTKADGEGYFTIPHVRIGEYTLWAYAPGVVGEFRLDRVQVPSPLAVDLGEIVWTTPVNGDLLWRIGIPDRSGAEFFIPGGDYRHWGLWLDYARYFPDGVVYEIGKSDFTRDWNYVQPITILSESLERAAEPWEIVFAMEDVPEGKGCLTIGIAASTENNLLVELNGETLGLISRPNDNAIYRSSIRGIYSEHRFEFDSELLRAGENRITLSVTGNRALHRGIIYDFVQLEFARK